MAQDGTSLLRFKRAMIDELQERIPNVFYGSPILPEEILGDDGSGRCVWWNDEADADHEVTVLVGTPAWFDETYTATLVLQCLGRDTDDSQEVCDQAATEMLGEAIGILASDPTIGITTDSDIQMFTALPLSWKYVSGVHGTSLRAGRFELVIQVNARLQLEVS